MSELTHTIFDCIDEYIEFNYSHNSIDDCERKISCIQKVIRNPKSWFRNCFEDDLQNNDSEVYNAIWEYGWSNINWYDISDLLSNKLEEIEKIMEELISENED